MQTINWLSKTIEFMPMFSFAFVAFADTCRAEMSVPFEWSAIQCAERHSALLLSVLNVKATCVHR